MISLKKIKSSNNIANNKLSEKTSGRYKWYDKKDITSAYKTKYSCLFGFFDNLGFI